jgi:hypothetical protein
MRMQLTIGFLLFWGACTCSAQWRDVKTPAAPRTKDGKVNLNAPAPKTADGKPDIAGIWNPSFGYIGNIAKDLKPGELEMQPWAAELYQHRQDTASKEDPTGWCVPGGVPRSDVVPYPFRIYSMPGVTLILYEAVQSFRQIFTDGRPLPKDPNPAWMGYSIGHWDGDAMVVETSGFNDNAWLDNSGHPGTESMKVTEKIRRKDYGHLEMEITVDDPKAYKKPWTVNIPFTLLPDAELIEYICSENNKDLEHLVGK